jgi:hypothetical protein
MAKLTPFILLALLTCFLIIRQLLLADGVTLHQPAHRASIKISLWHAIIRSSPIALPTNIDATLTNQHQFGHTHESSVVNFILLFFGSTEKMTTRAEEAEQQQ